MLQSEINKDGTMQQLREDIVSTILQKLTWWISPCIQRALVRQWDHFKRKQDCNTEELPSRRDRNCSRKSPRGGPTHLDWMFATHGIPDTISSNSRSPYLSHEMSEYCKKMGIKHCPCIPEGPQATIAESFVKLLCKLVHTSIAEGKDPWKEL